MVVVLIIISISLALVILLVLAIYSRILSISKNVGFKKYKIRFGTFLKNKNIITDNDITKILELQDKVDVYREKKFGEIAVMLGLLSDEDLNSLLKDFLNSV